MESMGMISKVDTPTPQYTGMVVVWRYLVTYKNCVRLIEENILKEVHPLVRLYAK